MTENEVLSVATDVLAGILGEAGFDHVDVRLGSDHDGDASFFVTAHFRPSSGVTDGALSMKAHTALWTRFLAAGEERFPYLDFRYPDDEVLVGEDDSRTI